MLYHNIRVGAHAASFVDAIVFAGTAALVWHIGAQPGAADGVSTLQWLLFGAIFAVAFVLISGRNRVYYPWRTEDLRPELMALTESAVYAVGIAVTVANASGVGLVGPLLLAALAVALVALLGLRIATRLLIRRMRRRGDDYRVWLIVGRNARSASIAQDILAHPHYGIRIAAIIDVPTSTAQADVDPQIDAQGLAVLDRLENRRIDDVADLQTIIGNGVVDEVLLTLPMRSCYDRIRQVLDICQRAGISVKHYPDAFEVPDYRRALTHVGRIPMLTHFRGPSNYAQLMAKRVLDVVCSALALVVLSPLLLGAALLVRASSPGPIFFLQTRVGLHGRQFRMIKFRSMYIDAPQRQAALRQANERDGAAFKMKHDPRITPLGRLLRKFHLDELPQLWNVLVGDMSLVGPRPLPVHESVEHEWWQRRRLTVPPGLTCFWQLQDDPSIPFQQWMRMDMDYIDRWSFWLDLKIIFLTFGTLARGRGW
jgi:exopolysaccharide biosynthesis polyprenyl glycosylphosphotransferase